MTSRKRTHSGHPVRLIFGAELLVGLILTLLAAGVALAAGNIDPTNKWAWSTNAGWINFAPDNGGVTVFSDHLEGYAWGENIGWIRLGSYDGGGTHTYANDAAGNYGVNNDGLGNLSGYAWTTNAGWINFDPDGAERVTIDPATGDFSGYAWAENVGWIHFASASPTYKVNTSWRPTVLPPVGNIDPADKYAWGTNTGWINFAPDNGGVTVFSDHLEGYAWGENIGWIRLGTCTGGSFCTHANTGARNYGVNNDSLGHLSGYAWGANAGWINFDPDGAERVIIDPATGDFDGYAWGENVGWIHFANASPTYKVNTSWRSTVLPPVGNIDPADKYAWGTNTGWINFAPENGGVTVYDDHLEGYAWGENIGWIRLGSHEGGGSHTYANDAAGTYGVNNDGVGNLSGYAWGANVGWINFDPDGAERVTIDPATGDFNGYAWGENVGWIHFRNDSPAYNVNTTWRGALTAVTDLRASKSGVNVALTWSDTGGSAHHYEVWRSSAPCFAPIPAEGSLIAPNVLHVGDPISFTDETSHLGNPDINDYYIVLAVTASGQKSLASNRVGAFDFGLQPGTGP